MSIQRNAGWRYEDDDSHDYSQKNGRIRMPPLSGADIRAKLIARGLLRPACAFAIAPFVWDLPTLRLFGDETERLERDRKRYEREKARAAKDAKKVYKHHDY